MTTYIDEHRIGTRGCRTYRRTTVGARRTQPLAEGLRSESYFTWELTSALRDAAFSETAMHPEDWDRSSAAHARPHVSIDDLLASRGYTEDGSIVA